MRKLAEIAGRRHFFSKIRARCGGDHHLVEILLRLLSRERGKVSAARIARELQHVGCDLQLRRFELTRRDGLRKRHRQQRHHVHHQRSIDARRVAAPSIAVTEARIDKASGLNEIGFGDVELAQARPQCRTIEKRHLHGIVDVERLAEHFANGGRGAHAIVAFCRKLGPDTDAIVREGLNGAEAAVGRERCAAAECKRKNSKK